ncbi:DNA cytosine methyltransferase [Brucella anthropi]|uniref:Cytosine-specific methyltransferase n=1 Tax=Brucella anthropi (strain ATCC 49188 / DSM 6882 / CCUG 24695 / JCM 21032 / LMG 3331 / NBRC 15819 / NCTC 12168 / Alc 37) TaxID=439375 RepID=A6WZ22_BRUA4|nr:DNA cytosine methyltransferase [Brucella anthropi]ABS14226.1 DNA-cytosine methyltransferase [Brucella anthropi ATCC 49188]QQC25752.1 DNA cytosine methyltransferase [Brucella anthropi]SUA65546.1 Modification methylase HaeIII [Brucella anthropi]
MRIWIERQVGLLKDTPGARKFPGTAHEFIDCTDTPSPAIVAGRPVHIVIERDGKDRPMTSLDKPPYQVPLMSDVSAMPWNGYNVISTFAGCGGSSTGYRMAGFRVLFASEFIEAARETYLANARPGTIVDGRDIRQVTADEILAATGLKPGELDVFDGSPPCASFSTAGKREKAWGQVKKYSDSEQRVDDLFFEYARLLRQLKPKVFVAENVSGLIKGTAKGYFLEILAALKACGYRVEARLLDAQWLGVPQARQRLIFMGVREDLGLNPVFPKPLSYRYSISDALPWLTNGIAVTVEAEADIGRFAIGEEWDKLNPGGQSDRYFQLVRPDPNEPSPTITAAGGTASLAGVTHPTEKRKFSIAELRRIGGFPDDFKLTGTYAQQWERIGRAVPPVMMSHIAATVRDEILAKIGR